MINLDLKLYNLVHNQTGNSIGILSQQQSANRRKKFGEDMPTRSRLRKESTTPREGWWCRTGRILHWHTPGLLVTGVKDLSWVQGGSAVSARTLICVNRASEKASTPITCSSRFLIGWETVSLVVSSSFSNWLGVFKEQVRRLNFWAMFTWFGLKCNDRL